MRRTRNDIIKSETGAQHPVISKKLSSTEPFESTWFELDNKSIKDIIVGLKFEIPIRYHKIHPNFKYTDLIVDLQIIRCFKDLQMFTQPFRTK